MNLTELFSNLTVAEQITKTDSVAQTLANVTVPEEKSKYPQELKTVVNIISSINK